MTHTGTQAKGHGQRLVGFERQSGNRQMDGWRQLHYPVLTRSLTSFVMLV